MKRFSTRSFWLVLLILCSTMGYAQKNVLCEDFTSAQLPTGWAVSGQDWSFQNNEVLFTGTLENGTDTLFAPLVSVAVLREGQQPVVRLDYRMETYNDHLNQLTLLYRTALTASWQTLADLAGSENPTTLYTELPFAAAVGQNVQIAIVVTYQGGGATAINYVAIENKREAPTAPDNFRVENLTTNSVNLVWANSKSDYLVHNNLKVSTSPIVEFSMKADVYDGNVERGYIELANLKPNTVYYAYVRYECEDSEYSPWAELQFVTPCEAVTIPYTETFENGLGSCYTVVNHSKRAVVNEVYPHNGSKAFQFVNLKGTKSYLFFPEANVDKIQDYQVSFYLASEIASNKYSRELTIGVADEADEASFTELKTIVLPRGQQWEYVSISLAGYKGTGKIVTFRAGNAVAENHIVIDDVTIEPASACPKPMFPTVENVTSYSARISWLEMGSNNKWNIVVATKPYTNPAECVADAAKGEFSGVVTTNPYELTNLLPMTTYYVYVQSACSSDEWTDAVSFTTGKAITLPYTETFDRFDPDFYTTSGAVPEQWLFGARSVNPNYNNGSAVYDKEDNSRVPYIVSSSIDHSNSAYTPAALVLRGTAVCDGQYFASYAMLPAMPVDVNTLVLSFWAYSNNGQTVRLIVGVADVQSNEIETGKQLAAGGNVTPVDTLSFKAEKTWQQFTINLTQYAGTGKYITFYVEPGNSTPGVYIDDISIDYAPTCFAVQNLSATATGTTSFVSSWTETLNATAWNIKVASHEIDPATEDGDIVAKKTVTTLKDTTNNLQPNTTYYVYVSPACGDLWTGTTVTTIYALTIPYYNDFSTEPTGSGKKPNYWLTGNMGQSTSNSYKPYVYTSAWSVATGHTIPSEVVKPSLFFNAYYSKTAKYAALQPYAIMPELSNAEVKDVVLSFWGWSDNSKYNASYCFELKIGVLTDLSDLTTLEEVASVTLDTTKVPQYFIVNMSSYIGVGKYIVFYMDNQTNNTSKFYIDNLSVDWATTPQRVTNLQVIDTTITTTSAKLKWKENGDAKSWNVRLFSEVQPDPSAGTPVKEYMATDSLIEVTGLEHSTQYFAYVQSVKGNEVGAWSLVASFWTKIGVWSVPFGEDFESYKTGGTTNNTLPLYYDLSGSTAKNYPYVYGVSSSYGGGKTDDTQKNIFYMKADGKGKRSQIVFPKFSVPVNTLQLTCLAGAYSSYVAGQTTTQIGVITADQVFHLVAENQIQVDKTWYEWFVDFSSYTGEDGQIAIRVSYNETLGKSVYIAIDNIRIVSIPDCKRVTTIKAADVVATSASLSWEAAGEETAWNLKVSTTPLASPSDVIADTYDGQVTDKKYTLENIEPNTTYYVYVQSVRADKECVGDWSTAISFTTLCLPLALPYTEDFEGYDSGIIPDCYTLSGDVKDKTAASVDITQWYKDKVLKLSQVAKTNKNYCVFPLLDCKDASELQLRMVVMPTYCGTLGTPLEKCSRYYYEVGVMTNPEDPTTYTSIAADSLIADGTTTGRDRYYSFADYKGDDEGVKGKYIAIRVLPYKLSSGSESAGSICIDDVEIDYITPCTPPTGLKVEAFDNDTVKLSWAALSKQGNFRVRLFEQQVTDPGAEGFAVDTLVSDTNSVVIKNLKGNIVYYAYVRKECGDANSVWSLYATWHSECSDIQMLPYIETFETYTAAKVPNCWNQITGSHTTGGSGGKCNGSETDEAVVRTKTGYGNYLDIDYGYNSLCGGKPGVAKAITPRLNVLSLREVVVYFDAKTKSNTSDLTIEAVESPDADAAAIEITTIKDISSIDWRTYYVDLADYYESAQPYQYLRFSSNYAPTMLDNLHITTSRNEIIPVQSLSLQSVDATTAAISFVEAMPSVKQWVVEYGQKGFAIGSGTQVMADTTFVILNGLAANTSYDVYVRANVANATFAEPLSFTTTKPVATLPYHYGFEDANENENLWKLINTNATGKVHINQFAFGDATQVDGTGTTSLTIQHEGNCGYHITGDAQDHSYDYAVRYINIPTAGNYVVGIKARNQGNLESGREEQDFFAVSLAPSTVTPVGQNLKRLDGTSGSPTTTKAQFNEFNIIPKTYGEPEYKEFVGQAVITQPGVYQLLLYWQNYSFGIAGQAPAIDSVWVEKYECTEPSDYTIAAMTDTTATISWFAGDNSKFEVVASRYRNSLRPDELEAADQIVHEVYTGQPTYTVKGLKPNTAYAFYQRTICADGATDWHEVDFQTNCSELSLPYTELFPEKPACWNLGGGVKVSTSTRATDDMDDTEEVAEWSYMSVPMNSYVVLPDFGVPANRLAISMDVFNLSNSNLPQIEIGVVTSPYDMDSYTSRTDWKYTLQNKASSNTPYAIENVSLMLYRYQGDGQHIVIKSGTSGAFCIRNLTVRLLPECVTPQLVEVTSITETSALVNWITGNESEWEIALNTDTFKVYEQPYDLSKHASLVQGTTYSLSMRTHCDDTHTSDWTTPVQFTTTCGVNDLPLIQSFDGMPIAENYSDLMLNCWQQMYSDISIDSVSHLSDASRHFTRIIAQKVHNWDSKRWCMLPTGNINYRFNGRAHIQSPFAHGTYKEDYCKWLFLPVYAIENNTVLSFDLAFSCLDGKSRYKSNTETPYFCIVATTNDGKTFTKVQDINLVKYDSVFTKVKVDVSKFAGQNVKFGFYHTTKYVGEGYMSYPAIRIADIRLNCTQQYNVSDNVCEGYNYVGNGFALSRDTLAEPNKSVTFTRFATNADADCDSIVSLTLTTLPTDTTNFSATICQGEVYQVGSYSFTEPNPTGTPYRLLLTSVAGCDSIVSLTLSVKQPQSFSKDTVLLTSDLPFVFMGQEVLAKETAAGEYTREIVVEGEPCNTTYNWHVKVKVPDGLENIDAGALNIYPTWIEVGQSVNLTLPASAADSGLRVEVCDMLGKTLATYLPSTSKVVLSDFATQGIYIIRVASDNAVYGVGRVIVK